MDFDRNQMKKLMILISFAIILMWLLDNLSEVWKLVSGILGIISPFVIGFAIAFIFNTPMMFLEKKLFGEKGIFSKMGQNLKRPFSYVITLILFVGILNLVSFIIVPEMINTIQDLSVKIPSYWGSIKDWTSENLKEKKQLIDWISGIDLDWEVIQSNAIAFLKSSILDWIGSTFTFASSIFSGVTTFLLAFVFSIYLLLQKETLISQLKKLIDAFFPDRIANKLLYVGTLSNSVFSSFISGQVLEAIIIGLLFFIAMIIFKFPYALMISVLIGITALIPVFGAFIGCILGGFFILVADPVKAAWFLAMFLVIQQIEGNLIYPQVVGKASGLPSVWILVAVTVGGSLMGVLGILLFIPLASVIYRLLGEYVNYRLEMKKARKGQNA
ncbi:hypothetical protein EAL2_c07860 [Peptoclostridium acidaminophilum DSM 3953]|uniref:Permease n=1 Tax=Peptoclostridium acidaminophilum DSM 3953 TaxID=1286171 RepID=W8U555_PEPAC|nr:AI-2E family transporter [Peptoclostridium acidaminophilum]AHM56086.1 hypothetical protein EAL2_c07860 [Peptoclostridium acidaminophilum DSM 3953]